MGLISIPHPSYIDLVVLGVRPEPLDENNLPAIIDGSHKSVIVAFNIEDDDLHLQVILRL